ncbi:hypothetical protein ACNAN0_10350 [Agrilactobacillus fermenti]|uniref:hypothetical protein n=1 Tax=Agrilactobacillus fermenti TaxID=2586909 RepID=UPI003A5BD7F5
MKKTVKYLGIAAAALLAVAPVAVPAVSGQGQIGVAKAATADSDTTLPPKITTAILAPAGGDSRYVYSDNLYTKNGNDFVDSQKKVADEYTLPANTEGYYSTQVAESETQGSNKYYMILDHSQDNQTYYVKNLKDTQMTTYEKSTTDPSLTKSYVNDNIQGSPVYIDNLVNPIVGLDSLNLSSKFNTPQAPIAMYKDSAGKYSSYLVFKIDGHNYFIDSSAVKTQDAQSGYASDFNQITTNPDTTQPQVKFVKNLPADQVLVPINGNLTSSSYVPVEYFELSGKNITNGGYASSDLIKAINSKQLGPVSEYVMTYVGQSLSYYAVKFNNRIVFFGLGQGQDVKLATKSTSNNNQGNNTNNHGSSNTNPIWITPSQPTDNQNKPDTTTTTTDNDDSTDTTTPKKNYYVENYPDNTIIFSEGKAAKIYSDPQTQDYTGHNLATGITDWKTLAVAKNANGQPIAYKLGENQWVKAGALNFEAPKTGVLVLKQGTQLFDTTGNPTGTISQSLAYKVFAERFINGAQSLKLGSDQQWAHAADGAYYPG